MALLLLFVAPRMAQRGIARHEYAGQTDAVWTVLNKKKLKLYFNMVTNTGQRRTEPSTFYGARRCIEGKELKDMLLVYHD